MKKFWVGGVVVLVVIAGLALLLTHHKTTPQTTSSARNGLYVAMGDSVAAGIGIGDYTDPSACNRSTLAYPELVASSQHYTLKSLACSGATITQGITGVQTVNGAAVTPQLDALFQLGQPKLISLTIGANDMGWTDILTQCYRATCGSDADTATVDAKLATLQSNLQGIMTKIADHYSTKPRVVLTGYYQLLPASLTSCPEMAGLDASELTWERAQQDKLNATLRASVSGRQFASFASIDFSGHELCTDTPWIQTISGLAPFHPTAIGQQTYAKAIK